MGQVHSENYLADLIERAAERIAKKAARLIIVGLKERYRAPITERQLAMLSQFRRAAARYPGGRIPLDDVLDTFDGRVLPGLLLRGLVRWRWYRDELFMEQKEPDES